MGINAFFNPFAMLLVRLDGQNNYKVFFEMLQVFNHCCLFLTIQSNLHVRLPPISNSLYKTPTFSQSKPLNIILKTLVNDHLSQVTVTTLWADGFVISIVFNLL